jgi:hypothetical protein
MESCATQDVDVMFYESSDKFVTLDFLLIVLPLSSASFLVSPRLQCLNEIAMILMLVFNKRERPRIKIGIGAHVPSGSCTHALTPSIHSISVSIPFHRST